MITGSDGLVGSRFIEISENKTFMHTPTRIEMDITNSSEIKAILKSYDFRAIVHFAAFTDVTEAEKQRGDKRGDCFVVNVEGTKNLVEAVKTYKKKIHFIQISTDMVFAGTEKDPGPYAEDHQVENNLNMLTWYGYTKKEAERIIKQELGDKATIVRITYPVRASFPGKLDYIRKLLNLYDQGKLYPLFDDQQICISFIDEVCRALDVIISEKKCGIFHVCSVDMTTPYELLSYTLSKTRGSKNLRKIHLDNYLRSNKIASFRYPKYGGLKVDESQKNLKLKFSTWKGIVDQLVAQGL